jgi:hypothetical protein
MSSENTSKDPESSQSPWRNRAPRSTYGRLRDAREAEPRLEISPNQSVSDGEAGAESLAGRELAAALLNKNVHPVLIFGSKGSGKTSLIASLLRYMRDQPDADATVELAEDVYPNSNHPQWARQLEWSRDVFYKRVFGFIDGEAPPSTQQDQPFFVPVRITRKTGEQVTVAFLEGKGEWYQADMDASVPFKPFKDFLAGVLQNFSARASVIYLAPYVSWSHEEPPESRHLRLSDIGLVGAIESYENTRRAHVHHDQHLFLISKWDVFCGSIASYNFIDPDEDEILAVLSDRYKLSWTKFLNARFSEDQQNKGFSVFSSGVMDGNAIARVSDDDGELLMFYSRKLWDWVYCNATGQVLYQDVRPKPPGLVDKIIGWLRR